MNTKKLSTWILKVSQQFVKSEKINSVTEQEALGKLENNKVADSMGLCSEHLKLCLAAVTVVSKRVFVLKMKH